MALRMWGQYIIQADTPAEDPVIVGTAWYDLAASAFKICTSVSPYTWASTTITTHNLLSVTHPDTTPASVQRGDLVTGQGATPTWSRLARGASGTYLRSNGTDLAWAAISAGDLPATILYGGGTAGTLPKWTAPTTLGDSILTESGAAITVGGTVQATLVAAGIAPEAGKVWKSGTGNFSLADTTSFGWRNAGGSIVATFSFIDGTGMIFDSNSNLKFRISGADKVHVDASGNVGIGVAVSNNLLGVRGAVGVGLNYCNIAAPADSVIIENTLAVGATSAGAFTAKIAGTFNVTGNVTFAGAGNSVGTITSGIWNGTALGAAYGGTGLTTYAVGDLIYASATTPTLSRLAAVAAGSYLRAAGVNTAPVWSTLILPNAATATYIAYATGSNTLGESANLTFNGSTLAVGGNVAVTHASNPYIELHKTNATDRDIFIQISGDTFSLPSISYNLSTTALTLGGGGQIAEIFSVQGAGHSFYNDHASFNGNLLEGNTTRAANSSFNLLNLAANSVDQFVVRGDGLVTLNNRVRLKGYTVATLPAGTQGDFAFATDLLAPAFLTAATGGGAVVGPVFYDGTNWVTV